MTNEQINVAIAEACGWNPPPEEIENITHGGGKFMPSEEWRKSHIPNYCNDLNAMHEVEETLKGMNKAEFAVQLTKSSGKDWPDGKVAAGSFAHIHATALQRAEAFLRTLGKWEEAK
jgi:hypothetical protein